jgi:hypothetical protein
MFLLFYNLWQYQTKEVFTKTQILMLILDVMTIKNYFINPAGTGLLCGTIGGLSIIVAMRLTSVPLMLLPYLVSLVGAIITIALTLKSKTTFHKLFFTGLLTFMVMSLIPYLYISYFLNPGSGITMQGHLWRIGIMLWIGIIYGLILASAVLGFGTQRN